MESIKITAKTLDEAITKACIELGVTSEMLKYDIVETGSNGVFGIGAKPYVINASQKCEEAEDLVLDTREEKAVPEKKYHEASKKENHEEKHSEKSKKHKPEKKPRAVREEEKDVAAFSDDRERDAREHRDSYILSEEEVAEAGNKAVEFLSSVLAKMGVDAKVDYVFEKELNELYLNVAGEDMGVLIGKRGQTLDALQYITGQVINKHQKYYVRVKLDTENYRERRKDTLETLAENIAHKVRRTKRPVALEPMNPYERRIIHSRLQGEKDVTTRSEGEEPYRHVVVCPVKRKK